MTEDKFPTARYTIGHCLLNKTKGLSHVCLIGFPVLLISYSLSIPVALTPLWRYQLFGGEMIKEKIKIYKQTRLHAHTFEITYLLDESNFHIRILLVKMNKLLVYVCIHFIIYDLICLR